MWITIKVPEELCDALREVSVHRGVPIEYAASGLLRTGLENTPYVSKPLPPFKQRTANLGKALVNLDKALKVAADLEDEEFIKSMKKKK